MEIKIHQRMLHPKQSEIKEHPSKRKVICNGRQVGKTTLAAHETAERLLRGERVLYAGPTQEQCDVFWDEIKRIFQNGIDAGAIYKNEQKRLLVLPNKGRAKAKTAWDADSLRGDNANFIILDEYALMNPDAWGEVGAPMLLKNNGDAWFISTPKRRNHFFHAYLKAKSDTTGRWAAFHATSHDNPHLSKEALEDITEDMTEDAYRQEILAEFLESDGMVFRNIDACLTAPSGSVPSEHSGHRIVAGVDWGQANDSTAVSIGCATCREELILYRSRNREYRYQRERIRGWHDRWKLAKILAESNSMGQPNIEEMYRAGLPVEGFATTASSKPPLIEGLQHAIENRTWKLLPDAIGKTELEAYEVTYGKHGHPQYSAPQGVHDDTVIARALMVREANKATPMIAFA